MYDIVVCLSILNEGGSSSNMVIIQVKKENDDDDDDDGSQAGDAYICPSALLATANKAQGREEHSLWSIVCTHMCM